MSTIKDATILYVLNGQKSVNFANLRIIIQQKARDFNHGMNADLNILQQLHQ